jgi:hypothetical protein
MKLTFLTVIMMVLIIAQTLYAQDRESNYKTVSDNIEAILNQKYPLCKIVPMTELSSELQQYLVKIDPHYRPGLVCADFNGDGIEDYALLLQCRNSKTPNNIIEKFVIVIGRANKDYDWRFINQWDDKLSLKNLYLSLVKPSTLKEVDHGKTIQLKNPGVELNLFEAAAKVFYLQNGEMKYIQVSD